jgi:hypothetical protein
MTQQQDSGARLAALASAPDTVSLPALWTALPADDRAHAVALAIREDRALRPVLVAHLQKTPRYKAFRAVSFSTWSPEKLADATKALPLLPPEAMQAGLIALHVRDRSAMLGAFLDSLGVPHEQGVIGELAEPLAPSQDQLARAADDLAARYPRDQVVLYFLTLLALEPEPWGGLAAWLARQPARAAAEAPARPEAPEGP